MRYIFGFLGIAVILVGVREEIVRVLREKGRGRVLSHFIGAVTSILASGVVLYMLWPGSSSDQDVQKKGPEASTIAPVAAASAAVDVGPDGNGSKVIRDLGMTPDEYAARFDEIAKRIDMPFRIRFAHHMSGVHADSVRADLDERTGLIGRVSKMNGKLLGVTLIARNDGTPEAALNIVMIATAAMTVAIPDATVKTVMPKLSDMVTTFKEGEKGQESLLNGVKLYYTYNDRIGNWFTAEPS